MPTLCRVLDNLSAGGAGMAECTTELGVFDEVICYAATPKPPTCLRYLPCCRQQEVSVLPEKGVSTCHVHVHLCARHSWQAQLPPRPGPWFTVLAPEISCLLPHHFDASPTSSNSHTPMQPDGKELLHNQRGRWRRAAGSRVRGRAGRAGAGGQGHSRLIGRVRCKAAAGVSA